MFKITISLSVRFRLRVSVRIKVRAICNVRFRFKVRVRVIFTVLSSVNFMVRSGSVCLTLDQFQGERKDQGQILCLIQRQASSQCQGEAKVYGYFQGQRQEKVQIRIQRSKLGLLSRIWLRLALAFEIRSGLGLASISGITSGLWSTSALGLGSGSLCGSHFGLR